MIVGNFSLFVRIHIRLQHIHVILSKYICTVMELFCRYQYILIPRAPVIRFAVQTAAYDAFYYHRGKPLLCQFSVKLQELIRSEPRRWIAQEVINFKDLETMEDRGVVYRKADLRAFVLSSADSTVVWKSGLTRFARQADSFVVNSSQGGGFKDTWVMRDHQSLPKQF